MRTVTFSDRRVADYLNDHFVCIWMNRSPGTPQEAFPRIADFRWEQNFPQGTGNGAVNMYFCTSNGYVMNELGGFWAPEDFLEEARFAVEAARELTGDGGTVARGEAARELTRLHDEAVRRLTRELWGGRRPPWNARDSSIKQRINFHRAQARAALADVEGLYNPQPVGGPGG